MMSRCREHGRMRRHPRIGPAGHAGRFQMESQPRSWAIDGDPDMRVRECPGRPGPERSVPPTGSRGNTMGLKLRLILVLIIPPILVVGVYGLIRVRIGRAELL